ncbi:MAG: hypothetical protein IJH39_08045 [Clostridia bacterium]|nr:hypothetical protein [Clostridia bacterium]
MEIKFTFDETNVQVGFENQFKIKDLTDKTLVKLLMLKGEKGDNGGATKTSELINDSGFITDDDIPTIPTKTSDLNNDSGFVTKLVNDLTNYYLKSETYTKTEVNNLIGQLTSFSVEVVQSLPTTDISTTTIYLVAKSGGSTGDVYNEYLYINNSWELIGTTAIDLSNYYNKTQVDTLLNGKQPLLVSGTNIKTINGNNILGSGNITIDGISKLTQNTYLGDLSNGVYVADGEVTITYPITYENNTIDDAEYSMNKGDLLILNRTETNPTLCNFSEGDSFILITTNNMNNFIFKNELIDITESQEEPGLMIFDWHIYQILDDDKIADSLTNSASNYVLSARQGKILNDTKADKSSLDNNYVVYEEITTPKKFIIEPDVEYGFIHRFILHDTDVAMGSLMQVYMRTFTSYNEIKTILKVDGIISYTGSNNDKKIYKKVGELPVNIICTAPDGIYNTITISVDCSSIYSGALNQMIDEAIVFVEFTTFDDWVEP